MRKHIEGNTYAIDTQTHSYATLNLCDKIEKKTIIDLLVLTYYIIVLHKRICTGIYIQVTQLPGYKQLAPK